MISNSTGACIVAQCVSRNRGRKFAAEFVMYGTVGHDAVLSEDPWSDAVVVAPALLVMLVTELQDSACLVIRKSSHSILNVVDSFSSRGVGLGIFAARAFEGLGSIRARISCSACESKLD